MARTYLAQREVGIDVTIGLRIRAEVMLTIFEENEQLFLEATSKGQTKAWPLKQNQCVRVSLAGIGFKFCIQGRDEGSVRIQPYINVLFMDVKAGGGIVLRFGKVPQSVDTRSFLDPSNGFQAEASGSGSEYYGFFEDAGPDDTSDELEQVNL